MVNDNETVRRELLNYLGNLPRKLSITGDCRMAAEVALDVGNCLLWISPKLEPGPHPERGLDERADSLFALGKQLRVLGEQLAERKDQPGQRFVRLDVIENRVDDLTDRMLAMERIAREKGGAQ